MVFVRAWPGTYWDAAGGCLRGEWAHGQLRGAYDTECVALLHPRPRLSPGTVALHPTPHTPHTHTHTHTTAPRTTPQHAGTAQYDQPSYHFEGRFAKGLPAGPCSFQLSSGFRTAGLPAAAASHITAPHGPTLRGEGAYALPPGGLLPLSGVVAGRVWAEWLAVAG
jgi:hypothetical protein